ncbi:hypothetical protein JCM19239_4718 [Vibrio variabilis]|uniref:Uncharacterized protein n=1 Tax=Vibrio variabilis TaxID=990271 RepID=A0ABQ0JRB3_9VIBR|nr:hypothetical protein JCM19239_4718 [Vibrio variabilis]
MRDSDLNEIANWSPRKPEFDRNKLKQRMEKLTIKQRKQIRQTISSRL